MGRSGGAGCGFAQAPENSACAFDRRVVDVEVRDRAQGPCAERLDEEPAVA